MKFVTNLDLNKNELQNARLQNLATAPQNPVEGQIYYNTTDKMVYKWDGVQWSAMGSAYTLPVATDSVLGGVKIGDGVSADSNGVLSTDIQTIKVNGTAQTVTNKEVNLEVAVIKETLDPGDTHDQISIEQGSRGMFFNEEDYGLSVMGHGSSYQVFWKQLVDKNYVDNAIPTKTSDLTNDGDGTSNFVTETDLETALGDYLELAGGTMTGAIAMGSNKITGLADPTADGDAANKKYVDAVATGALKHKGSVAFANLPALGASVLNNMYNVTDAFTTTADFVEGAGKEYPAGTNVAIINTGTDESPVYKYDAMTGVIDTSDFATKTEVNGLITATTGTIATDATTATVAYTGTLLEAYATQNGAKVITDMAISASSVVFTCASAPSSAITCTVVSAGTLS